MKMVYIASPYAGDIEKNTEMARKYCRYAADQGAAPVAPHLLYPQFLDEYNPSDRARGLRMGLELLAACDELWVFGPTISSGMAAEIAEAKRMGIETINIDMKETQEISEGKKYGVLAKPRAGSMWGGGMKSWCKNDGEVLSFGTYEEAAAEAERMNGNCGPVNRFVDYYPKELEIEQTQELYVGMGMRTL